MPRFYVLEKPQIQFFLFVVKTTLVDLLYRLHWLSPSKMRSRYYCQERKDQKEASVTRENLFNEQPKN